MPEPIAGLHHVTAITSDPQRSPDFYCEVLRLRLVKRTVNFDDPSFYHFYFGDDLGSPGSILTFFAWPHASKGHVGTGETSAIAFLVPSYSLSFWEQRILAAGSPVEHACGPFGDRVLTVGDPDGLRIELVGSRNPLSAVAPRTSDIPPEHAIRGFDGVTFCEASFELTAKVLNKMGFAQAAQENNRIRFVSPATVPGNRVDILVRPQLGSGHMGAGTVHHIAFRAPSESAQLEWRDVRSKVPLNVTAVLDRTYFRSIYFREPGGALFEIATDTRASESTSRSNILEKRSNCRRGSRRAARRLNKCFCRFQCPACETSKQMPNILANRPFAHAGHVLKGARGAVILLHGRGSSAENILRRTESFYNEQIAFLAPQAANNSWYPYSFLAPVEQNEPWLSSAIARVESLIQNCVVAGIERSSVVVCGFSQGACLATEFIARHPARYGALIAFTGGLVGPSDRELQHDGSLAGTTALFSSGDPDPHVPWSRVEASARELERMGARVDLMRYTGRPHTILNEELEVARSLIFSLFLNWVQSCCS